MRMLVLTPNLKSEFGSMLSDTNHSRIIAVDKTRYAIYLKCGSSVHFYKVQGKDNWNSLRGLSFDMVIQSVGLDWEFRRASDAKRVRMHREVTEITKMVLR